MLDGHDAGPPGVHDDRSFQAHGGAPARGRSGVHQEHEPFAEGRLLRLCRRAVSRELPVLPGRRGSSGVCDASTGAIYGYNAACSIPGGAGKSTTFTCTADYGNIVDGDVWACVIAADASTRTTRAARTRPPRPTRPTSPTASCDSVVVDRTPPVARDQHGRDDGQGRRSPHLPGHRDRCPVRPDRPRRVEVRRLRRHPQRRHHDPHL